MICDIIDGDDIDDDDDDDDDNQVNGVGGASPRGGKAVKGSTSGSVNGGRDKHGDVQCS